MREERAGVEEVIDKGRETATESRGFRLEAEIFLPRRRTFWRMPSMEYGNIFGEVEYRREGLKGECAAICLFSPFFMDSEATCCPDALSLQCVWGLVRRRIVWFSPPVLFSHLSRSVFKFLLTYGDKYLKILL